MRIHFGGQAFHPDVDRIDRRCSGGLRPAAFVLVCLLCIAGYGGCRQASEHEFAAVLPQIAASDSRELILREHTVTDRDLRAIASLKELEVLEIYHGDFQLSSLQHLSNLTKLRRLRLERCPIENDAISEICKLKSLEVLNLPAAEFDDSGLAAIATLPQLHLLRFGSQHVSDEGLRVIASMPRLRFLHLLHVPITDAGIEHLSGMHQLESFYLDGGNVSEAGLERLIQALPELHFHRDQTHLSIDPRQGHDEH